MTIARAVTALAMLTTLGMAAQPSPLWRAVVSGEREYELKQSATAPDGTVWLLLGARPKGKLGGGEQSYELRQVTASGDLKGNIAVAELLGTATNADPAIAFVGTNLVIAARSSSNAVIVARVDPKKGTSTARQTIEVPGPEVLLTQIAPLSAEEFLLLGRSGANAWLAKVSLETLAAVWNRTIDEFPSAVAYAGTSLGDGGFALTGAALAEPSQASVWIAVFDKTGAVKAHAATRGMQARIASSGDGYVVLHDDYDGENWNLWARGFDASLKEQWTQQLGGASELPPSFEVARTPEGQWIASAETNHRAWVGIGNGAGEIVWSYTEPPVNPKWEHAWNAGRPSASASGVVLPYTALTVEKSEQRQVVRVVKLARKK